MDGDTMHCEAEHLCQDCCAKLYDLFDWADAIDDLEAEA